MVSKFQVGRIDESFQFNLEHADIISMMNDPEVLLAGGAVPETQVLQVIIKKPNGSQILCLRDLQPDDTIIFKFNFVQFLGENTPFNDVNVS